MKKTNLAMLAVAVLAVTLSLTNASWIAPKPAGKLIMVAHHGITQPAAPGAAGGKCPGVAIAASDHNYLENTVHAMKRADLIGADALALPVQRTRDGLVAVFRDAELDCRTDGSGPVAALTLAELKRLDAGHDYTPDGGRSFPLRGRIGGIQSLDEVLPEARGLQLILTFVGDDPAEADAVADAFRRAGRAIDETVGFIAAKPVADRIRQIAPEAWLFDPERSAACMAGYGRTGWAGLVPDECRGAVLAVPVDSGWRVWGWPYRFLDRMAGADARVMLVGSLDERGRPVGITDPQSLADVPRHYRGMLWIENMYDVGRALQR